MKKGSPALEWHYLDSPNGQEAWAQHVADAPLGPAPRRAADTHGGHLADRKRHSLLLIVLLPLCLMAAVAGYRLWQSAQSGLEKIRQEIQLAAAADFGQCVAAAAAASKTARLDPQASNEPRRAGVPIQDFCIPWQPAIADYQKSIALWPGRQPELRLLVEEVEVSEPYALASVRLRSAVSPALDYRSTLLFQQMQGGWRHGGDADAALWGALQTSHSPLVQFEYHDRDAAALRAVTESLVPQYAAWRTAFGLAEAPAQPIVIRSATAFTEPREAFRTHPSTEWTIPSPLLLVRPVDQSMSAAFAERAGRLLLLSVIDEALRNPAFWAGATIPEQWRLMVDGLYLSLERMTPAGEPHKQVQKLDLPLSLITFGPQRTQTVFTSASSRDSERGWIVFSRPSLNYPGKYWAAESVADYILQNYPADQLAAMLSALPRHESWETLAPAVFGTDALTFQAQWRDYVSTHYPLE